jgi:hypothetical protein
MERLKDFLGFVFAVVCVFALLAALYQAWNERLASASALATLSLVCALLVYIPQIEVLKALSVEVRMRQTLSDAERIIERLRQTAQALAEVSYFNAAYGSRLSNPSAQKKQAILTRVNEQLRGLGVPAQEIKGLAKDYLLFLEYDLGWHFRYIVRHRVRARLNEGLASGQNNQPFIQPRVAYQTESEPFKLGSEPSDLRPLLESQIPKDLLPPEDIQKLRELAEKNASVFQPCIEAGAVTPEAAAFIDAAVEDNDGRKAYKNIFGQDPPP